MKVKMHELENITNTYIIFLHNPYHISFWYLLCSTLFQTDGPTYRQTKCFIDFEYFDLKSSFFSSYIYVNAKNTSYVNGRTLGLYFKKKGFWGHNFFVFRWDLMNFSELSTLIKIYSWYIYEYNQFKPVSAPVNPTSFS